MTEPRGGSDPIDPPKARAGIGLAATLPDDGRSGVMMRDGTRAAR